MVEMVLCDTAEGTCHSVQEHPGTIVCNVDKLKYWQKQLTISFGIINQPVKIHLQITFRCVVGVKLNSSLQQLVCSGNML